ncbi:cobalamin-binding protein [Bacillus methanolicus]|uniref:ABC transporter n=1 Tax=Bacillus methanolicus (strain MGA3 / ATCC 53907) TaxID=796606 RepID=I3DUL2_BACMM|nr:cobalamin-binding protein [Bacillus methanolicus]AIE61187.1 ABC transporter [Bacillus methanolicus MGA3]EIJ77933.1 ABC transporter [Bacillus methanolicus MGA3]
MRIISLCPSNTEVLGYLGLADQLIGVDDFSDWPKSVHHLPRLGPDLSIDIDMVEKLNPDLVIASLSVPGMEKNVEELNKRKIPHIILNPQSLSDIQNDLVLTGKALNEPERGLEAAKKFQTSIEDLKRKAGTIQEKRPSLYWEWWPKPVFTPGKLNWLTEISELAGATNLFKDIELASVQTDWQDVYERNPDYICLAWVGVRTEKVKPEILLKRPGWRDLKAIKKGNVFVLEEQLFCRPSPRLLEGAKKLLSLLTDKLTE